MSKLNKLIHELCPDGVEYRKLGEVCEFVNGFAFKSNLFREDGDKIIRITNINGRTIDIDDIKYFHKEDYKAELRQFVVKKGDILIAMSGATTGKIGYYNYDDVSYLNQRVGKFKPNDKVLLNRYLYHILLANTGALYILAGGGAQPNLSSTKLMDTFSIPLPPLPIQEEIVKILDRFAEYTAELQAELQARKEQYEYYRNLLLTNNFAYGSADDKQKIMGNAHGEWKWMTLGEVGTFTYGYTDKAKNSGDTRFIRITDITEDGCLNPEGAMFIDSSEENKKFLLKKGDLLMARTGATYGKTLYVPNDTPSVYASFLIKISLDDSIILNRYYWHFSKSSLYWGQANKLASKGGQPQFNANALSLVKVLIPPLAEQQRIVSILDKFEALVSDLTQGLPAEIAASQERYEYYRDKLLRFERCN